MEPRLTASLRVAALLHRADLECHPAYVLHRGDDMAGALALSVVRPGGTVELWAQEYDLAAESRVWAMQAAGAAPDIAAAVARRRAADPDLWVIELELPENMAVTDLAD